VTVGRTGSHWIQRIPSSFIISLLLRKRPLFPGGKLVGGRLSVQSEETEPDGWGRRAGVRSSPGDAGV
jgi:hypothetical protein